LRALGADDALIADCLDIDEDGISTLLEIGERKLEHAHKDAEEPSDERADREPTPGRAGQGQRTWKEKP
jgi:hypothetical protein